MHHRAHLHRKRYSKLQGFRLPQFDGEEAQYSRLLVAARSQQRTKHQNTQTPRCLNCVARTGHAVSKISFVRGLEIAPQSLPPSSGSPEAFQDPELGCDSDLPCRWRIKASSRRTKQLIYSAPAIRCRPAPRSAAARRVKCSVWSSIVLVLQML